MNARPIHKVLTRVVPIHMDRCQDCHESSDSYGDLVETTKVVPKIIDTPRVIRCSRVTAQVAMTEHPPLIIVVVIIETEGRGKQHLAPMGIITVGAVLVETLKPATLK